MPVASRRRTLSLAFCLGVTVATYYLYLPSHYYTFDSLNLLCPHEATSAAHVGYDLWLTLIAGLHQRLSLSL